MERADIMTSGSLVLEFRERGVWYYFQLKKNSWNLGSRHQSKWSQLTRLPETEQTVTRVRPKIRLLQCPGSVINTKCPGKEHKEKKKAGMKYSFSEILLQPSKNLWFQPPEQEVVSFHLSSISTWEWSGQLHSKRLKPQCYHLRWAVNLQSTFSSFLPDYEVSTEN